MSRSEESIESWDDVRNRFDDLLKRPIDRFAWHRDILQRYLDGRLVIHLHVSLAEVQYCLTCRRLAGESEEAQGVIAADWRGDETSGRDVSGHQQRHPMLVGVYQLMEPPQRLIPTVVGLNRLDLINRRCGDLAVRQTVQPVHFRTAAGNSPNGKSGDFPVIGIGNIKGGIEVATDQFPNDIVQRGPRVGDAISYESAEAQRGLRGDGELGKGHPECFVFLGSDYIWLLLDVHSDLSSERIDVLLCPDDFEPSAV
jgi:hypothetical protein